MKINSRFHILIFFTAVLIFSMPFAAIAQQNSVAEQAVLAVAEAEVDANKDVNKPLWFATGGLLSGLVFVPLPGVYSCLLPPVGLAGIYFYQPNPPAERFIGKSAEYVAIYSETYKKERSRLQVLWSTAGCASGSVVITGCTVVGLVSAGVITAISELE